MLRHYEIHSGSRRVVVEAIGRESAEEIGKHELRADRVVVMARPNPPGLTRTICRMRRVDVARIVSVT